MTTVLVLNGPNLAGWAAASRMSTAPPRTRTGRPDRARRPKELGLGRGAAERQRSAADDWIHAADAGDPVIINAGAFHPHTSIAAARRLR